MAKNLNICMKLSCWFDTLSEFLTTVVQSWAAMAVQVVLFLCWVSINAAFIFQVVSFDIPLFIGFILFNCAIMAESVFFVLLILTASTTRSIEALKADHNLIASLKSEIKDLKELQR